MISRHSRPRVTLPAWLTLSRVFSAVAACLFLQQLLAPLRPPATADAAWARYLSGEAFGATPVAEPFSLFAAPGLHPPPSAPDPYGYHQRIFTRDESVRRFLWGTWVDGDEFTGALRSSDFTVAAPFLYLPITGSPALAGESLVLCVRDAAGNVARRLVYDGINPRENIRLWEIDARGFQGARAYLELTDTVRETQGWVGVGRPLLHPHAAATPNVGDDLGALGTTYGAYCRAAALLAALLFLPGVALGAWRPRGPFGRPAYLALPGLGLLAGYGLALWLGNVGRWFLLGKIFLGAMTALALGVWLLPPARRIDPDQGRLGARAAERWSLLLYAAVCLAALQFVTVPLPVSQEWYVQSSWCGRLVASAPDNVNPYQAGVYSLPRQKRPGFQRAVFQPRLVADLARSAGPAGQRGRAQPPWPQAARPGHLQPAAVAGRSAKLFSRAHPRHPHQRTRALRRPGAGGATRRRRRLAGLAAHGRLAGADAGPAGEHGLCLTQAAQLRFSRPRAGAHPRRQPRARRGRVSRARVLQPSRRWVMHSDSLAVLRAPAHVCRSACSRCG